MATWIIEPRDPLIARDGRPFGPTPGARARSLAFPYPSTIAGGVRTLLGLDAAGIFDGSRIAELKRVGVRGPLLVEMHPEADEIAEWLAPSPADALLFGKPGDVAVDRRRLEPLVLPDGAVCNTAPDLAPVGLGRPIAQKPLSPQPRFWRWNAFQQWLAQPADGNVALADIDSPGPALDSRLHVGMDHDRRAALDGALFQTTGLDFAGPAARRLSSVNRMALAAAITERFPGPHRMASLGGERRLARWLATDQDLPACPPEVRDSIIARSACRVILLTPACFHDGYRPSWLLEESDGVKPKLAAIAVSRAQIISGWDFATGHPKPTRRLAPAGTVLFLALSGDSASKKRWVDRLWMSCVSDAEQDRLDGFGLAVLGAWNGQPARMEVA